MLQPRLVLSCNAFVEENTLFVQGDELSNNINIFAHTKGAEVACDGPVQFFPDVTNLQLESAQGDDEVSILLTGGITTSKVSTGAGGDIVNLQIEGSFADFQTTIVLGPDTNGSNGLDSLNMQFDDTPREFTTAASLETSGGGSLAFNYHVNDSVLSTINVAGTEDADQFVLDVNTGSGIAPCSRVVNNMRGGDDAVVMNFKGVFHELDLTNTLGAGDDLLRLDVDTGSGVQPCYNVAIDAGLGSDTVHIRGVGSFTELAAKVDLGPDRRGAPDRLSLHFEDTPRDFNTAASLETDGGGSLAFIYHVNDAVLSTIDVAGTAGADQFALDVNTGSGIAPCSRVVNNMRGGDDAVVMSFKGVFHELDLTNTLGAGDDLLRLDVDTGSGVQPCYNVAIDAGLGSDTVRIRGVGSFTELAAKVDLGPDRRGAPDRLSLHFEDTPRDFNTAASLETDGGGSLAFIYHVNDSVLSTIDVAGTAGADQFALDVNTGSGITPCVRVVNNLHGGDDVATISIKGHVHDFALTSLLGEGNDKMHFGMTPGIVSNPESMAPTELVMDVDSGDGHDQVELQFAASADSSRRLQADLRIAMQHGRDLITVGTSNVIFAGYDLIANTGADNDQVVATHRDSRFYPPDPATPFDEAPPAFVQNLITGTGRDAVATNWTNVHVDGSSISEINSGDGDDIIRAIHKGTVIERDTTNRLSAGRGEDVVISRQFDTSHGSLIEIVDGGEGDDIIRTSLWKPKIEHDEGIGLVYGIDGRAGNDRIDTEFLDPDVVGGLTVGVEGGLGSDDLSVAVSGGSIDDGTIVISGGAGRDMIGLTHVDLMVVKDGSLLVDAGDGNDVVDITLRGTRLNGGVYTVELDAGEGDDQVSFVMEFQPGSTGTFDGRLLGADGDDRLRFELYPDGVSVLDATLDGGNDIDECMTIGGITVLNCEL